MKLEELKDERMFCLVAPDGFPQVTTLSPDYATCIGMAQLMAKAGLGQSVEKMFKAGFEILPVDITMVQAGNAEEAFQQAKNETT